MPSHSRPSPNAVIHDWLSHAEAGLKPERYASSLKGKRTSRVRHHHRRLMNGENHLPSRGSVRETTERRIDCEEILGEAEHDTHQLAQRLGLRTPFRALDSNQRQTPAKGADAIATGKRKRSLSPLSPHPRPRDGRERLTCSSLAGCAANPNRSIVKSRLHLPESSTAALNSSKIIAKPYERRLRHKTRADHYTLKEALKGPQQTINEGESPVRKKGKRTRKEKSGSALMHDFTARNVAFSRLTLPSAPVVGIFRKGRASSPIKRMGLPDLAFSEVSFLKSRRDKSQSPHEPLEKSLGQSKRGFAHDDAVISRYFSSTKHSLPHRPGPELHLSPFSKQSCHGREVAQFPKAKCSIKEKTLLPLLELPETPFLGFGSSGLSMSSPVKQRTPLKTPYLRTHSPAQLTSPTCSTTYFTWSRSGAVSQDSLPLGSASNLSPISGLSNECQPHRAPTGHVHAMRHEAVQMECPSGHDDAPRQSEAIFPEVQDEARISDIGRRLDEGQQPINTYPRSEEPCNENSKDNNRNTPWDVRIQEFSANGSTKTSLADKTLVASLDAPFTSCRLSPKNTASLNSLTAAFDGLNRRFIETPSRKHIISRYQTAIYSGATEKEADGQVCGHAVTPGHEVQDRSTLLAEPTSGFGSSSYPSAPTIQPPPTLLNQSAPSSGSSSSVAWLSRDPRSYEYGAHRVPLSKTPIPRTRVMRRSPMSREIACHGYDNMYERQEIQRSNLSNSSVGNMQRLTPMKTPRSEQFKAPEEYFTRPHYALNPYRRLEKMGFRQPEEHNLSFGDPLNQYPEDLRGTRYRYINPPAFFNRTANVGDEEASEPQAYEEYSHDEPFDAAGPGLGQQRPLQLRFDVFRRPGDLTTQDYPLFEPYVGNSPLPWSQATPSHPPQSRGRSTTGSSRPHLDKDEESRLADFWKPNLLY